jgi:hypothetical protein
MHELEPIPDDSEQLFLRADNAVKQGGWMIAGGVAAAALAALGLGVVILLGGSGNQLQLHAMTTMPIIIGIMLLGAGWMLLRSPVQVAVGPEGITIEGRRGKTTHRWEQIGWAMAGMPGMGGRRVLTIFDTRGKTLAQLSDAFDQFDTLVELVKQRVAARQGDTADRLRRSKSRRLSLISFAAGISLSAAAIGVAWMTHHDQRAARLLAEQGVEGEGQIVRRFVAPNGVTRRLEYSVKTDAGLAPQRNAEVEKAYWDSLEAETTVPVIYVPAEPSISKLAEGEIEDDDPTKQPLMGYGLAAVGGLIGLGLFAAGIMQFCGWDLDLDSKSGKLSFKRFGTGT